MDHVKDSPRYRFASSSIIVFSLSPGRPVVLSPSFCGSEGHVCGETVSEPVCTALGEELGAKGAAGANGAAGAAGAAGANGAAGAKGAKGAKGAAAAACPVLWSGDVTGVTTDGVCSDSVAGAVDRGAVGWWVAAVTDTSCATSQATTTKEHSSSDSDDISCKEKEGVAS